MTAGAADAVAGSPGTQEIPILEAGFSLQASGCVASPGSDNPLDRNAWLEASTTRFNLAGTLAASDAGPSAVKRSPGKKSPGKKSPGKKGKRATGIGNPA
jgi:hypothetical protein